MCGKVVEKNRCKMLARVIFYAILVDYYDPPYGADITRVNTFFTQRKI